MAGPLTGAKPGQKGGDYNLTGGQATSVSDHFAQDAIEVRRSAHMDRPARIGTFSVSNGASAHNFDQKRKTPAITNLRTKPTFVPRRKRK